MRLTLLLLFGFFQLGNTFGSDTLLTHIFKDDAEYSLYFNDSLEILPDKDQRLTIDQILHSLALEFARPEADLNVKPPLAVWSGIRLLNETTKTLDLLFRFYPYADSVWVYTVVNGQVTDEKLTGSDLKPARKSLRSSQNFIPVSLDAGMSKTFYFRIYFSKAVSQKALTQLAIFPAQNLTNFEMETYALQCFYAGVMLLFCIVSVFMYFIFRERFILCYASLMFFFAVYFPKSYGVLDSLLTYQFRNEYLSIGQLIVSGVVVSVFLFASTYLRLPKRLPGFYHFYLCYSVFVAVFAHVFKLQGYDASWVAKYHNFLVLPWIIMGVVPVIYFTKKGDKAARTLLISIGILLLGSILFLLTRQQILPSTLWTKNSYQIGTVFFSGFLFYGLFDQINAIREEKQRLQDLDRLKSRFFANISHEFRTPLTLVMGPLRQLLEKTTDSADRQLLEMAHRNASRQLQLINQILDLSKLEAGKMKLQASEKDFIPHLKGIVNSFSSLAEQKDITLKLQCPEGELLLYFNSDKMEHIFYNLLSNAFKFTPSGGVISVILQKKKGKAVIAVTDTGAGIPAAKLPNIFDRFFQADQGMNGLSEGSGIGLALVKELVQLHSGVIGVESDLGKGTTFTIQFPMGREHLQPHEIVTGHDDQGDTLRLDYEWMPATSIAPEPAGDALQTSGTDAARLLIVEDNEDVRAFIRQRLENHYHIIEAVNGEDGIRKTIEYVPDLVISDVMMPEKNGYELCSALKTDLRTSHIPVILLTAKAAQEEKLEGLETGADAYLVKPFDSRELLVRVQNLIRQRQQLRERFATSITLKPSELVTNSLDKEFLENAMQTVEANLGNEDFNIETMAHAMNMSRPNLNRKLRALVNQSTNQFIQSVRLQQAASLLQQNAGTVAEIAFRTGFGSSAYFVKCFRDQFGETPGNFMKKEENE